MKMAAKLEAQIGKNDEPKKEEPNTQIDNNFGRKGTMEEIIDQKPVTIKKKRTFKTQFSEE